MQDHEFLKAIVEAPDDVAPRLVYADWLDEIGDPRGEFIRVQCERETLSERDPRCRDLDYREAQPVGPIPKPLGQTRAEMGPGD